MEGRNEASPRVLVEPFRPVSVFLCPCRVSEEKARELLKRVGEEVDPPGKKGRFLEIPVDSPFEESLVEKSSSACPSIGVHARIHSKILLLLPLHPWQGWGVLALQAELKPHDGASLLTFQELLAFNSYFRYCQGAPERQDTPVAAGATTLALSSGRIPEAIYREVAERELGGYSLPSPETKKAVTLCQARFDRELTNEEIYLFGTIGHPDEQAEPSRAEARVRDQSYDRWRCNGLRYFFHSYSLVCAIGPSSQGGKISVDLDQERGKFLKHYVEMGARLALMRARLLELQEDWRDIQGQEMNGLRQFHQNLVDFRNVFGILWTAEGTQRTEVEQMWRKISGLDERAKELEECLEQTLDFYEAQAADKLNRVMEVFQILEKDNIEVEAKFLCPEEIAEQEFTVLLRSLGLQVEWLEPRSQRDIYLDEADGRLFREGSALRVRSYGGKHVATFKGPGSEKEGIFRRPEIEWELPPEEVGAFEREGRLSFPPELSAALQARFSLLPSTKSKFALAMEQVGLR